MSANPLPEPAGRFCAREGSDAACEPIDFSAPIREGDVIDLALLKAAPCRSSRGRRRCGTAKDGAQHQNRSSGARSTKRIKRPPSRADEILSEPWLHRLTKSESIGISRHSCWTGCALRCRRGSQERPKYLFFAASWDFTAFAGNCVGRSFLRIAYPEGLVPEGLRSLKWFTGTRSSDRIGSKHRYGSKHPHQAQGL